MKTAICTGISGMDGSILADLLLEKGYKIYGLVRRNSRGEEYNNANHLADKIEIVEGDLTDLSGLVSLCNKVRPDFFYNMAAQSHVKTSFEQPVYTAQVDAIGVLNCLEAIRQSGIHTRFLQASTSEMYGGLINGLANETSPFHPRSPYGCAKLYGYWITVNYRESYKMFACNTICFNHECFFADTPVITKYGNDISIQYVSDLIANRKNVSHDTPTLTKSYNGTNVLIWNGFNFVKLKAVSRKKLESVDTNKTKYLINTRSGITNTTYNHKFISSTQKTGKVNVKEDLKIQGIYRRTLQAHEIQQEETKLLTGNFPKATENKIITQEFAEFLGMLVGDGYVSENGTIQLINNNPVIRERFRYLATALFPFCGFREVQCISGFQGTTYQTNLIGISSSFGNYLREEIYHTRTKHKKVPDIILNNSKEVMEAFLDGYNATDGLKAGNETYLFASFKTNSPLLAQGLLYLITNITGQTFNINAFEQNNKIYYQLNLHSPNNPNGFGSHLKQDPIKVKKIIQKQVENQHVFDIETESGYLMAGIGLHVVGNSPRRSDTFVTKKITKAVANIKAGKQDKLFLGNLDAKRDWGWAEDFCKGIISILESNEADDYVLATGETHTVREFCEVCFNHVGLNYKDYVVIDPKFYRPAEVDILIGDYSKIKNKLGWEPTTKFKDLAIKMLEYDIQNIK